MKHMYGFQDEVKNLFKLLIYEWNASDARKYYKHDKFCLNYCIHQNHQPYGCTNSNNKCQFEHLICLRKLAVGRRDARDYIKAHIICMYLMYTQIYNNNNPLLFCRYAYLLTNIGKIIDQTPEQIHNNHIQAEKYYLKALSIDPNCGESHEGYAKLLYRQLKINHKAEYHFKQALNLDSRDPVKNSNFGGFLISQGKYHEALLYIENALEANPSYSCAHLFRALALDNLNRLNKALTEYQIALTCNENDDRLKSHDIQLIKKNREVIHGKLNPIFIATTNKSGDQLMCDQPYASIVNNIGEINNEIKRLSNMISNAKESTINLSLKSTLMKRLAVITAQLNRTQEKCNKNEKRDVDVNLKTGNFQRDGLKTEFSFNFDTLNLLEKKRDDLKQKVQDHQCNIYMSHEDTVLPFLVELKEFKQEIEAQKQTYMVCFVIILGFSFFFCGRILLLIVFFVYLTE